MELPLGGAGHSQTSHIELVRRTNIPMSFAYSKNAIEPDETDHTREETSALVNKFSIHPTNGRSLWRVQDRDIIPSAVQKFSRPDYMNAEIL